MKNKIHCAFAEIQATDEMKLRTINFLKKRRGQKHLQKQSFRPALAICAALICFAGGYSVYAAPISYISVDVNPSVELGLNYFDKVITVNGYNYDGERIVESIPLKYKPYKRAIELLLTDEVFNQYLTEDSLLTFTVVSGREEALLVGIQDCESYKQHHGEASTVDASIREEAQSSGMSFGKYQAYLELFQYDASVTADACNHMTMRQIRDLTEQHATGSCNDTSSTVQQSCGHSQTSQPVMERDVEEREYEADGCEKRRRGHSADSHGH